MCSDLRRSFVVATSEDHARRSTQPAREGLGDRGEFECQACGLPIDDLSDGEDVAHQTTLRSMRNARSSAAASSGVPSTTLAPARSGGGSAAMTVVVAAPSPTSEASIPRSASDHVMVSFCRAAMIPRSDG